MGSDDRDRSTPRDAEMAPVGAGGMSDNAADRVADDDVAQTGSPWNGGGRGEDEIAAADNLQSRFAVAAWNSSLVDGANEQKVER